MIFLMDHPGREAALLYQSLQKAGYSFRTVALEDDGFLPEGVESPYRYFGGWKREKQVVPLYFSRLEVPDLWEIRSTGTEGSVWDYETKRAQIRYAEPVSRRYIQTVNWLDSAGKSVWQDHYDDAGNLYARTTCDAEGRAVLRSYYAEGGEERLVENLQTHVILLREKTENGRPEEHLFRGKVEFILYYLKKTKADCSRIFFNSLSYPLFIQRQIRSGEAAFGKQNPGIGSQTGTQTMQEREKNRKSGGDVLFWQEDIYGKLPGNMVTVLNDPMGVTRIAVQLPEVFRKIREQIRDHAGENGIAEAERAEHVFCPVGQIYSVANPVKEKRSICILTNSDAIEHLSELTGALPQYTFRIGALTEMSDKLMAMGRKPNVFLYPGMGEKLARRLLEESEFYLDINHGNEIVDAVWNAWLQRSVIFAFRETVHNPSYVPAENIVASDDWNNLIRKIRETDESDGVRKEVLQRQDEWAMRMTAEDYKRLLG